MTLKLQRVLVTLSLFILSLSKERVALEQTMLAWHFEKV
jgi:hypothetical protein